MPKIRPIWFENNKVKIIDQRLLPSQHQELEVETAEEMYEYIKTLAVRGAPAIGNASGFGIYLGVKNQTSSTKEEFLEGFHQVSKLITSSRPTAVNLFWAADRMERVAETIKYTTHEEAVEVLLDEAKRILAEDIAACKSIGLYGADEMKDAQTILTHCNAGAMATSEYGTALAPIYVKHERGENVRVYADETRPLLQGSRITAWELFKSGVDVTVIADSMAGVVLRDKSVEAIIVGADRISANGDTANKIGTYALSVLAKEHGIPMYVAAPFSTVDFDLEDGSLIPIEERDPTELTKLGETHTAPEDIKVYNPAFDVTPNEYITAIITDKGVAHAPFKESLKDISENGQLRKD